MAYMAETWAVKKAHENALTWQKGRNNDVGMDVWCYNDGQNKEREN